MVEFLEVRQNVYLLIPPIHILTCKDDRGATQEPHPDPMKKPASPSASYDARGSGLAMCFVAGSNPAPVSRRTTLQQSSAHDHVLDVELLV